MKTNATARQVFSATLLAAALALPMPVLAASDTASTSMSMGMSTDTPIIPAVNGFIDGE